MQQPQRRQRAFGDLLPRSPEDLPRVYAWFEQMRSNQPVFRAEQMPIWQVFRYEDVQEVITDHHRFSSEATFGDSFLANTLVSTDPPITGNYEIWSIRPLRHVPSLASRIVSRRSLKNC